MKSWELVQVRWHRLLREAKIHCRPECMARNMGSAGIAGPWICPHRRIALGEGAVR